MPLASIFQVIGSLGAMPAVGAPSGQFNVIAPLCETQVFLHQEGPTVYDLASDSPVSVGFGGVANATVIFIKTVGGKVRARFTSADGSTQAIPVDSMMCVMSASVPFTALDLTRVPGQNTTVEVFIGSNQ